MSIDLNKIIAKKNYCIPVKATDLCDTVLKQLKLTVRFWNIKTKRPKSADFRIDDEERYVSARLVSEGKSLTAKNIERMKKEWAKDPISHLAELVESTLDEVPWTVNYIVTEERIDGCTIKTTCKSVLYEKIVRATEFKIIDLQHVKISCEEFLDQIFIGGLGGKEMPEVKEIDKWELLINDVHNRQIHDRLYDMLNGATTCVLLMGWIGTDCLPKLKELKDAGVKIKAITHKPSEYKAPVSRDVQEGYAELTRLIGLSNVSANALLHGRALVVDNKALIGSMDFNAHSLSGEHIEFAIYTEDQNAVRSLRGYFESMFKPLNYGISA